MPCCNVRIFLKSKLNTELGNCSIPPPRLVQGLQTTMLDPRSTSGLQQDSKEGCTARRRSQNGLQGHQAHVQKTSGKAWSLLAIRACLGQAEDLDASHWQESHPWRQSCCCCDLSTFPTIQGMENRRLPQLPSSWLPWHVLPSAKAPSPGVKVYLGCSPNSDVQPWASAHRGIQYKQMNKWSPLLTPFLPPALWLLFASCILSPSFASNPYLVNTVLNCSKASTRILCTLLSPNGYLRLNYNTHGKETASYIHLLEICLKIRIFITHHTT